MCVRVNSKLERERDLLPFFWLRDRTCRSVAVFPTPTFPAHVFTDMDFFSLFDRLGCQNDKMLILHSFVIGIQPFTVPMIVPI